ncbi:amidohydrolase family protein [Pseudidiomarina insulisalsae]|uniref:Amidohydrolase-related domain-containing protein n=1 Tax=Pseudidiomarina insulisalsae TaxID=575789 RepID=A0A432YMG1_9GAMM|nr:amidohydrolase family protein [Pseudidiomarina insulisalsae]RUO62078.1 hypothetical protein CWI71_04300 [Pseudidiomarina insulisalsae]
MIRLFFLVLFFLPLASGAQQQVLRGATLYDGTGADAVSNSTIVIEAGEITCVGHECKYSDDAEVVDLSGHYVTPGLIDAHVHYAASGWFDTRPWIPIARKIYDLNQSQQQLQMNVESLNQSYLCSGVTAVFDTGSFPWTTTLQVMSKFNTDKPRFVAAGQLITHDASAATRNVLTNQVIEDVHEFLPMSTDEEALGSVATIAASGASAVKVWFVDPAPERRAELQQRLHVIADAAHRAGLQFIVHATELENAKAAVKAGADVLVHSVFEDLIDEDFVNLVATNEVVYQPTLIVAPVINELFADLYLGRNPEFDDPNHCIAPEVKQLVQENWQKFVVWNQQSVSFHNFVAEMRAVGAELYRAQTNVLKLYEGGATIATATDAGNPGLYHGPAIYRELEEMQAAGIPAQAIITMSTQNGAKALGLEATMGTVEVGKNADLVILTEDPGEDISAYRSISHVMRFGKLHRVDDLNYDSNE